MAQVRETLLRWRHGAFNVAITAVLDDADLDIVNGPGGEETYRRVLRFEIDGNLMRGGAFRVGAHGRAPLQVDIPDTLLRTVPVPLQWGRITEQGLGWDFTPTHEDVRPGSVSNPSLLTSGGNAAPGVSDTTAAFTPTASSLLVVGWGCQTAGTIATTFTYTNTHAGSGSWAAVEHVTLGTSRNTQSQARCQMGASPGSGAITNTYGAATPARTSWIIAEVTGHHTTTPLSESNTGGASNGTALSFALGGIAAGNLAIGTMVVRGNTAVTPGTSETELAEATSGGGAEARTQMQYGTDTTVDWSWTSSDRNAGVAVEYAQAAAGGAVTRSHAVIIS
jgi:hypothetical protein